MIYVLLPAACARSPLLTRPARDVRALPATARAPKPCLVTCDFDVPSAMPRACATSRCSSPDVVRTKAARTLQAAAPARARCPSSPPSAPQPVAARLKQSALVVQRVGQLVRARRAAPEVIEAVVRGTDTTTSQCRVAAESLELPVRREKISCSRSSASAGFPSIRQATLNSLPACARYSSSNAARSPRRHVRRVPCPGTGRRRGHGEGCTVT